MNIKYILFLIFTLVLFLLSCSENKSALDGLDGSNKISVTVSPKITKTKAGESMVFTAQLHNNPRGTQFERKWSVEPSDLGEVESHGKLTVTGLGKGLVICRVYDQNNNYVSADTAYVYSELITSLEKDIWVNDLTSHIDGYGMFAAGSASGNLFKSDNQGISWEEIDTVPSNYHLINIARSHVNPDILMATYGDSNSSVTNIHTTGILLSHDNGNSWTEVTHPAVISSNDVFYGFNGLVFDNQDKIYVLSSVNTQSGGIQLHVSSDFGNTWQTYFFSNSVSTQPGLYMKPENPSDIFIPTKNGGGYYTTNGGSTWNSWPESATDKLYDLSDDGILYGKNYIGSTTNSDQHFVYSSDNATTWQTLFVIKPEDNFSMRNAHTLDSDIIAVLKLGLWSNSTNKVRFTTDRGTSWHQVVLEKSSNGIPVELSLIDYDNESITFLMVFRSLYTSSKRSEIRKYQIFYNI